MWKAFVKYFSLYFSPVFNNAATECEAESWVLSRTSRQCLSTWAQLTWQSFFHGLFLKTKANSFLSPDDFLRNNLKNHLYTSAQVSLLYLILDVREVGPRTSWSTLATSVWPVQKWHFLALWLFALVFLTNIITTSKNLSINMFFKSLVWWFINFKPLGAWKAAKRRFDFPFTS